MKIRQYALRGILRRLEKERGSVVSASLEEGELISKENRYW